MRTRSSKPSLSRESTNGWIEGEQGKKSNDIEKNEEKRALIKEIFAAALDWYEQSVHDGVFIPPERSLHSIESHSIVLKKELIGLVNDTLPIVDNIMQNPLEYKVDKMRIARDFERLIANKNDVIVLFADIEDMNQAFIVKEPNYFIHQKEVNKYQEAVKQNLGLDVLKKYYKESSFIPVDNRYEEQYYDSMRLAMECLEIDYLTSASIKEVVILKCIENKDLEMPSSEVLNLIKSKILECTDNAILQEVSTLLENYMTLTEKTCHGIEKVIANKIQENQKELATPEPSQSSQPVTETKRTRRPGRNKDGSEIKKPRTAPPKREKDYSSDDKSDVSLKHWM